MKDGPDIARIAALIGDPARANILAALLGGQARTATELAQEAGVTPQTASTHLAGLADGGLVAVRRQGRHRYFALTDDRVAALLETLSGLAADRGHMRTRPGPRDAALRRARVCYNHLAGDLAVRLFDGLVAEGSLDARAGLVLTPRGFARMGAFGLDLDALVRSRAALVRDCLDWSERRSHLGGALGRAIFARITELGWALRVDGTRIVRFTPDGERRMRETFRLAAPLAA